MKHIKENQKKSPKKKLSPRKTIMIKAQEEKERLEFETNMLQQQNSKTKMKRDDLERAETDKQTRDKPDYLDPLRAPPDGHHSKASSLPDTSSKPVATSTEDSKLSEATGTGHSKTTTSVIALAKHKAADGEAKSKRIPQDKELTAHMIAQAETEAERVIKDQTRNHHVSIVIIGDDEEETQHTEIHQPFLHTSSCKGGQYISTQFVTTTSMKNIQKDNAKEYIKQQLEHNYDKRLAGFERRTTSETESLNKTATSSTKHKQHHQPQVDQQVHEVPLLPEVHKKSTTTVQQNIEQSPKVPKAQKILQPETKIKADTITHFTDFQYHDKPLLQELEVKIEELYEEEELIRENLLQEDLPIKKR